MNEDIRAILQRELERSREAMDELDRKIAELEQLVMPSGERDRRDRMRALRDHITPVQHHCPAAKCELVGDGAPPVCGSWFCPGRGLPRCGNCGGKGDVHESWCGKDEGDCP